MRKLALLALLFPLVAIASPALAGNGACASVATNSRTATPISPAALANVKAIHVVSAGDCVGLNDLTTINAAGRAALSNNPMAGAQRTRNFGSSVIGYRLEGHSLEVYVAD